MGGPVLSISLEAGNWSIGYLTAWFFACYIYHGLGITLGYHRLLTHKALKVPRWVMYVIVSGGYLCLMGSPIVWVAVHRLHHQKSDLPGDPHSPRDGFMHALVGWMFSMDKVQSAEELRRFAGDLIRDPVLLALGAEHKAWQAQLCLGINILFRLLLLACFGLGVVVVDILATFIVFWSTQLVNTVCHLQSAGYRLFQTRDNSKNVWWVALLALGEGWHNNHHAVPRSARHGMAWWEFDVTWLAIRLLQAVRLGSAVVLPPSRQWQMGAAPVALSEPVRSAAPRSLQQEEPDARAAVSVFAGEAVSSTAL